MAFVQGGKAKAVSVIVTLPEAMSAALGVYVQSVSEFGSEKNPVPLVDHAVTALFSELDPEVISIGPEPEQAFRSPPAIAVVGVTISVYDAVAVAGAQAFVLVTVIVRVIIG